jgi:hypothetical protein
MRGFVRRDEEQHPALRTATEVAVHPSFAKEGQV